MGDENRFNSVKVFVDSQGSLGLYKSFTTCIHADRICHYLFLAFLDLPENNFKIDGSAGI